MSERKQTPDVLADLLSAAPAPEAATASPAPAPTAPRTAGKPAKRKATQPAPTQPKSMPAPVAPPAPPTPPTPPTPPQWEYREVIFREFRGWRPRQVDGREQSNWKEAPAILDYLRQAGDDGWELVSVGEEHNYQKTAYFKRPKAP